ncbi:MAG TPA: hypothetical protein VF178_07460 [Gemmatimonadaceae bacterium]
MSTIIGSLGVSLLLGAFVLNLMRVLRADSLPYLALNAIGAGLAGWSAWLIDFMPFVILEGTWAAAAIVGLVRQAKRSGLR